MRPPVSLSDSSICRIPSSRPLVQTFVATNASRAHGVPRSRSPTTASERPYIGELSIARETGRHPAAELMADKYGIHKELAKAVLLHSRIEPWWAHIALTAAWLVCGLVFMAALLNPHSPAFENDSVGGVGPLHYIVLPLFTLMFFAVQIWLLKVRPQPLRRLRFVADAHLGGLARLLRMCGFDTLYDNHYEDSQIAAIAADQQRIVLTRDRELLKRRIVDRGCYLHALKPALQLRELFERLDLARSARPFSLCIHCNRPLHEIAPEQARPYLPPRIAALYSRFFACDACRRLYWQGSHWRNMRTLLAPLLDRPPV